MWEKTKRLDELFAPFLGDDFHPDGIVNETSFSQSSPRICYIMKDVNSTADEPSWDVRTMGRDFAKSLQEKGSSYATITSLAKIVYRIVDGNYSRNFTNVEWPTGQQLSDVLNSIAILNLKKTRGGAQVKWNDLVKEAHDNFDLWKTELDIIEPDLAICGGVYGIICTELLEHGVIDESEVKRARSGLHYLKYNGGTYIDMIHPNARISRRLIHSHLKESLPEIMPTFFP